MQTARWMIRGDRDAMAMIIAFHAHTIFEYIGNMEKKNVTHNSNIRNAGCLLDHDV